MVSKGPKLVQCQCIDIQVALSQVINLIRKHILIYIHKSTLGHLQQLSTARLRRKKS